MWQRLHFGNPSCGFLSKSAQLDSSPVCTVEYETGQYFHYPTFLEADKHFKNEDLCYMSNFTENYLRAIDYETILKNRLKKIQNTKTYLMKQWSGIEAHDKYKDKLTGCCQEGQVHHTLSERMSTDAKVWCENGIDEMSQLRAFTQNGGNIYQKIIDISTQEKRNKKIEALEKRIKKKANKKLFGTTGVSIPTLAGARDELYYELKNIWYGKAV